MMSNPEFMRQMLDNPMVQSLMSNPQVVRDLLMSNPQTQSILEVRLHLIVYREPQDAQNRNLL
jgi:hypothetical protein